MEAFAYLLPALGCAGMMAVMMWFMSRGRSSNASNDPQESHEEQLAALREELADLQAQGGDEESRRDPAGG